MDCSWPPGCCCSMPRRTFPFKEVLTEVFLFLRCSLPFRLKLEPRAISAEAREGPSAWSTSLRKGMQTSREASLKPAQPHKTPGHEYTRPRRY